MPLFPKEVSEVCFETGKRFEIQNFSDKKKGTISTCCHISICDYTVMAKDTTILKHKINITLDKEQKQKEAGLVLRQMQAMKSKSVLNRIQRTQRVTYEMLRPVVGSLLKIHDWVRLLKIVHI